MNKPNKRTYLSPRKLKSVDWLQYIDDCLPALVIPVGRRFQAHVPEWSGPANVFDLNTSKWLGTRIWPHPQINQECNTINEVNYKIGKGRPDSCNCSSPGSPQCIKLHISEEKIRLQSHLGPAYKSWKFNEMGEDVAKSWSSEQRKRFDLIVKSNPLSQDKSFLKPAESSFTSKTREDIVSYYLNVYVPKRISMITQSGCKVLDSSDDEVEAFPNAKNSNSLKRSRSHNVDNSKLAKSHYLIGRR